MDNAKAARGGCVCVCVCVWVGGEVRAQWVVAWGAGRMARRRPTPKTQRLPPPAAFQRTQSAVAVSMGGAGRRGAALPQGREQTPCPLPLTACCPLWPSGWCALKSRCLFLFFILFYIFLFSGFHFRNNATTRTLRFESLICLFVGRFVQTGAARS